MKSQQSKNEYFAQLAENNFSQDSLLAYYPPRVLLHYRFIVMQRIVEIIVSNIPMIYK